MGSVMSLGGLGGTYGGPPDCVKASYEKLHLTSDELQHLTRQVPSIAPRLPHTLPRPPVPPPPLCRHASASLAIKTNQHFNKGLFFAR